LKELKLHWMRDPLRTQARRYRLPHIYIYIMRNATLRRIFEEKVKPPEDLTGQVILFGAPSFIKEGERYSILSVGVTTSQRMEKYIPSLLSLGVRGLIGKGELSEIVTPEFRNRKALYFLFVGALRPWSPQP